MAEASAHPSFPAILQRFFVEHLRKHRAVSPSTVAAYRDTFRLLLAFAETTIGKPPTRLTLGDLDTEMILSFLDHLERDRGNCVRSRNARLAAIRSFLKYAAHQDVTAIATIERTLAVPQKRCDKAVLGFLTRPEMEAIIAAPDRTTWVGQRDRAMFTMLYNTGARVSEILDLRVGSVILDVSPVAHLEGKGRKRRSTPLWKPTAAIIRPWVRQLPRAGETAYLFPNSTGGRLSRSAVTQRLALAVQEATRTCPQLVGRAISPHTIRHTTAMHLLQAGVDITVIALWLGHEGTSTTHIYLEADLTMKEEALSRLDPINAPRSRYRPPDHLMAFLQTL